MGEEFTVNPATGKLDVIQGIDPLEVKGIQFDLTDPTTIQPGMLTYHDDGQLSLGLANGNHVGVNQARLINGSIEEPFDCLAVTRNSDTEVWATLEQNGNGDLTLHFSSGHYVLDCTGIATPSTFYEVQLTLGTDVSPQGNYVYVLESDPTTVIVDTTEFPTDVEHTKICYFLVPSAAHVLSDGAYVNQNWNDHLSGGNNMGHILHMAERSRRDGAYWFSGVGPAGDGGTYFFNSAGNVQNWKSTSGVIYQMHRHAFPAQDTSISGDLHVVNERAIGSGGNGAYWEVTDLNLIDEDTTGGSLNNSYFNLVFWGVANKGGEYEPIMVNLPTGSYNHLSDAQADASGYNVLSMPREFALESSTGFMIALITCRRLAGNTTIQSTIDLRGTTPTVATGGALGAITSFPDNVFDVFGNLDNTKIIALDADTLITGGNTRTITMADADVDLTDIGTNTAAIEETKRYLMARSG